MSRIENPAFFAGATTFSLRLKRNFSSLTDIAFAQLDTQSDDLILCTTGLPSTSRPSAPEYIMPALGGLTSCQRVDLNSIKRLQLARTLSGHTISCEDTEASWHIFKCVSGSGTTDHIALLLRNMADSDAAIGMLSTTWPILREDCLRDLAQPGADACDKAMLWMVASKIDVAILVMNARGLMLRANAAAKALLDSKHVLLRTHNGIQCINSKQTKGFVNAIAACAVADPCGEETVIFLDTAAPSLRIPVTLSRFRHDGAATDLVAVMMPTPPDSRRVEKLARAVGLTPAEARVASLLQMGLSNKDAARIAGLREQSVSTYAKRVLNKLNVTSRAEMAQMLTWQAAGGRL